MLRSIQLLVFSLLLGAASANAQIRELEIGDPIPKDVISAIINYTDSTINIADHTDKLIILDWWGFFCSSCIQEMPKMNALQQKFGDKVLIIPTTEHGKEETKLFWKKNKRTSATSLPSIVEDTLLIKYFPHEGLPYEVWIKDGKVFALTDGQYVNEKEVSSILKGDSKNWQSHNFIAYNYNKPLFQQDTSGGVKYYSAVGNYLPRVRGRITSNVTAKNRPVTRLSIINYPVLNMYQLALSGDSAISSNFEKRTILEVSDKNKFRKPKEDYIIEWVSANAYCYESILPSIATKEEQRQKLLNDLNVYFRLNGRIETRSVLSWILLDTILTKEMSGALTTRKGPAAISAKTPVFEVMDKMLDNYEMTYHESNFASTNEICKLLMEIPNSLPIVNRTKVEMKGAKMIKYPYSGANLTSINDELIRHGYYLKAEMVDMRMFVLSERK